MPLKTVKADLVQALGQEMVINRRIQGYASSQKAIWNYAHVSDADSMDLNITVAQLKTVCIFDAALRLLVLKFTQNIVHLQRCLRAVLVRQALRTRLNGACLPPSKPPRAHTLCRSAATHSSPTRRSRASRKRSPQRWKASWTIRAARE